MSTHRVAFPSTIEGLAGELSFHFGHALAFTIIEYNQDSKEVEHVEILKNVAHEHGKCMRPVRLLMNSNVDEIVVGGIGNKPCIGLHQAGIQMFKGLEGSVKDNFIAFLSGKIQPMQDKDTCKDSI